MAHSPGPFTLAVLEYFREDPIVSLGRTFPPTHALVRGVYLGVGRPETAVVEFELIDRPPPPTAVAYRGSFEAEAFETPGSNKRLPWFTLSSETTVEVNLSRMREHIRDSLSLHGPKGGPPLAADEPEERLESRPAARPRIQGPPPEPPPPPPLPGGAAPSPTPTDRASDRGSDRGERSSDGASGAGDRPSDRAGERGSPRSEPPRSAPPRPEPKDRIRPKRHRSVPRLPPDALPFREGGPRPERPPASGGTLPSRGAPPPPPDPFSAPTPIRPSAPPPPPEPPPPPSFGPPYGRGSSPPQIPDLDRARERPRSVPPPPPSEDPPED